MRLTKHEITLLLAVAAALTVGAVVKHYRHTPPATKAAPATARGS